MGRKPKVVVLEPGLLNVRCDMPAVIWELAGIAGHLIDPKTPRPEELGMRDFLNAIAQLMNDYDVSWLGSHAFVRAAEKLRMKRQGVSPELAAVNTDLLHQSNKFASGFVGVYPVRGNKFWRATARTHLKPKHYAHTIGDRFKSAIEAAWRRRQYYIANKWPYGELELELEKEREDSNFPFQRTWSDRRLVNEIKVNFQHVPGHERVFGPGSATWEPDEYPPDLDPMVDGPAGEQVAEFGRRERARGLAEQIIENEPKMAGFENGIPPELEESLMAGIKETKRDRR